MEYISVREAAEKWGISERRVRALCESNRIEGVKKCGDWVWSIPASTQRPADGRTLRYIKNRNLRTGIQNYKTVDTLKTIKSTTNLTEKQKIRLITEILAFESVNLTEEQVQQVLLLNKQNFDLKTHLRILNIFNCLSILPVEVNETSLKEINAKLLYNIGNNGGKLSLSANQAEETEAMLEQYIGPWSVLHPVARSAFLFSELMRISPFKEMNEALAFIFLENELLKSNYPPVFFGLQNIDLIRSALVSTQIRGNSQILINLIITSLEANSNENLN